MPATTSDWRVFVLAVLSGAVIPAIGFLMTRKGITLTRKTELDKIYMERLKIIETRSDAQETTIQQLREQHLADKEEINNLKSELVSLRATQKFPPLAARDEPHPGAF